MEQILRIAEQIVTQQPWWLWVIVVLVPICILITLRELLCWFWKINSIIRRLDRIEARLKNFQIASRPPNVSPEQSAEAETAAPSRGPTAVDGGDEEFLLE